MNSLKIALPVALLGLSAPAVALEPVTLSLDWTPNTNHIGFFVAQAQGYYEQAGLDVTILPFSRTGREADFMTSSSLSLFTGRAQGADRLGVLALIQRETGRLVYLGDREDIERPRDLEGLVYGGFGTAWEDALIATMIAHDGGDPDYHTDVLDLGVYEALDAGDVDFTLDIATWEGVEKQLEGVDIGAFAYADYGVPDQHTIILSTTRTFAQDNPDTVRAFVQATIEGIAFAIADPNSAADILIAGAPDLEAQSELVHASLAMMVEGDYLATPDGRVGLFDPAKMEGLGDFLFDAGALIDEDGNPLSERPDFSSYYTNRFAQ